MKELAYFLKYQFCHDQNSEFKHSNLFIFILSNILSIIAIVLNSSWLYNRFGESDHYAYLGAAVFFPKTLSLFPNHPIIELIPTYALTAVLYHLFPPYIANIIKDYLFVSLFLYMFINVGLFLTKNIVSTLLSTIILCNYYYFLQSIGSDYTDSFIQFFLLLHLFLIKAYFTSHNSKRYNALLLVSLGISSALMVSSGIMSVVYVACLILFFILLSLYYNENVNLRNLILQFIFWLLGTLFCILIISLYLLVFTHGYYMRLNIAKLFNFVSGHGQYHPLMDWLPYASWLIFPCSIFLFFLYKLYIDTNYIMKQINIDSSYKFLSILNSVKFCLNRKENIICLEGNQYCFGIFLTTTTLCLIFIQFFIKQWSLQFMYFSQINFIFYLGLSIIISKSVDVRNGFYWALFLIFSTLFLASYSLNILSRREINYEIIATNFYTSAPSILPWVAICALLLILIIGNYSKFIPLTILIFSIIVFNVFSYSELHGLFCCIDSLKIDYLGKTGTTSEKYFDANFKISEALDQLDGNRTDDIWFDETERLGPIFKQVFSMNYFNMAEQNLINKHLPELGYYPEKFSSSGHDPISGRNIILISEDNEKLAQAIYALKSKLNHDIEYEASHINIGSAKIHFYKTIN